MGGSLIGKPAAEVRRWAAWYLTKRKLEATVEHLLDAALQEPGHFPVVTKTRLRRAATRMLRQARSAARSTGNVA
jgi:hypothetical protein